MLHDVVERNGARIVGHWPTQGYEFDASKAEISGEDKFVGLGIDEDQQSELTKQRLDAWCKQIHQEFDLTTPLNDIDDD